MKILTTWLRSYLPALSVDDAQLAEDLTLRGIAVEGVFEADPATGGSLFDMDITTNRVDAMNHYGVAREAAAIYNVPLHPLDASLPQAAPVAKPFPVRIEAPDLCGRFTARMIRGVAIAPSEGSVSRYFHASGQKQISNAVDLTNFVMLGMGQPTHAFDADKIEGAIVVPRARAGEQLRLLDGSTRTLVPEDLVIADEAKALSLAGVMGGWDSMITPETTNVLVEAAWFDPSAIRASSRRHLIHTDASHRFERGADFAAAPVANALVTGGILAACGGTLEGELVDLIVPEHETVTSGRPPISLSVVQVRRILGRTLAPEGITASLVERFLAALGCVLTPDGSDAYRVQLPSWRLDLTREIDLIEEIARVYGYNGFANTLPTPAEVIPHKSAPAEQAVQTRLFQLGFSEAISSTFSSLAECTLFTPKVAAVPLENPLSEEAANLRSSLLPGMVDMLAGNLARDVLSASLFELGAIFTSAGDQVEEFESLALGWMGAAKPTPPHAAEEAPFFELKGAIESILSLFETPAVTYIAENAPTFYEPGRAAIALCAGKPIAGFGRLSMAEGLRRKLRQPIHLGEINLAALLRYPLRHPVARELSRFQAVQRDFSFVFPDTLAWSTIEDSLRALGIPELVSITLQENFRDPKKWPGVFSMLLRVTFQSLDRTLVDEELTGWWASIIAALEALGGKIRS